MGSLAELTLGCRQMASPVMVGNLFKAAPSTGDRLERVHMLDKYLKALEDERRKIEAFKRELPHCMQLLDYAIEASKERLVDSPPTWSPGQPSCLSLLGKNSNDLGLFAKETVEGFLKTRWETVAKKEDRQGEKETFRKSSITAEGDRPTWMAEAQLWSQPSIRTDQWKEKESSTEDSARRQKDSAEQSTLTSPAFLFNSKQRTGGAFMPFVKDKQAPNLAVRSKAGPADIALTSGESRPTTHGFGAVESEAVSVEVSTRTREVNTDISEGKERVVGLTNGGKYSTSTGSTTSGGSNAQRKARRCWSPELHRRFVSALQQLGGSQIATPKQIRELMKVDGLTNDEVKSHLQKYRLHTRRPSPTPVPQQSGPQLVVLGGIWVPPEYGGAGLYHNPSGSVSQQEPHFCQPSVSQSEFYSQLQRSAQIELHRSPAHSSPQGTLQSTSNLSSGARQTSGEVYREDSGEEDGKSENSNWKGDNNSRGSSEKQEPVTKHPKSSGDEEEDDDVDDADNERDSATRLELKMACPSEHNVKAEPQLA